MGSVKIVNTILKQGLILQSQPGLRYMDLSRPGPRLPTTCSLKAIFFQFWSPVKWLLLRRLATKSFYVHSAAVSFSYWVSRLWSWFQLRLSIVVSSGLRLPLDLKDWNVEGSKNCWMMLQKEDRHTSSKLVRVFTLTRRNRQNTQTCLLYCCSAACFLSLANVDGLGLLSSC